jgi:Ca2+-binding RTX toxin-like protein
MARGGNDTLTNIGGNPSRMMGGTGNDVLVANRFGDTLLATPARTARRRGGDDLLIGHETGSPTADTLFGGGDDGWKAAAAATRWRRARHGCRGAGFLARCRPGRDDRHGPADRGAVRRRRPRVVCDFEAFIILGTAGNDYLAIDIDQQIGGGRYAARRGRQRRAGGRAGADSLDGARRRRHAARRSGLDRLSAAQRRRRPAAGGEGTTLDGGAGGDYLLGGAGADLLTDTDRTASDTLLGEERQRRRGKPRRPGASSRAASTSTAGARLSWRTTPLVFVAPAGNAFATVAGDGLQVQGFEAYVITGGAVGDSFSLAGSFGPNLLRGMTGADSLSGSIGFDTLEGGTGHDTPGWRRRAGPACGRLGQRRLLRQRHGRPCGGAGRGRASTRSAAPFST